MSLREGDVYEWYYKDDVEYRKKSPSTAYWCMDNQAVVVNGELVDTYWRGVNKEFVGQDDKVLNPELVDLTFVCNINDVEFIKEYEKDDYDVVYDLSHQKRCYKVFAIDKGAQVSNKALLVKWQYKLEQALSEKRMAEYSIENAQEEISKLSLDCLTEQAQELNMGYSE